MPGWLIGAAVFSSLRVLYFMCVLIDQHIKYQMHCGFLSTNSLLATSIPRQTIHAYRQRDFYQIEKLTFQPPPHKQRTKLSNRKWISKLTKHKLK